MKLHRSILLWLGLLLLVLIGWAWRDSIRRWTTLNLQGGSYWTCNGWSALAIGHRGDAATPLHPAVRIKRPASLPTLQRQAESQPMAVIMASANGAAPGRAAFPPALLLRAEDVRQAEALQIFLRTLHHHRGRDEPSPCTLNEHLKMTLSAGGKGGWILVLPHWFLLLGIAQACGVILLVRARRQRRKAAALADPDAPRYAHVPSLRRSITFWSGLIIILFLAWAWWDSERHWNSLHRERFFIHSAWGGLHLDQHFSPVPASWPAFERKPPELLYKHRHEPFPGPFLLREGRIWDEGSEELLARAQRNRDKTVEYTTQEFMKFSSLFGRSRDWVLFIPYWLLILSTAMAWTALLFWRSQRKRRKRVTNDESPNEVCGSQSAA